MLVTMLFMMLVKMSLGYVMSAVNILKSLHIHSLGTRLNVCLYARQIRLQVYSPSLTHTYQVKQFSGQGRKGVICPSFSH